MSFSRFGGQLRLPAVFVGLLLGLSAHAQAARVVNFESPQTRPVAISSNGRFLLAVNTPDNRVSVFRTRSMELVAEVPVGLEPVSLASRPGHSEVWVCNHVSDTVDVIRTRGWQVTRTIPVGDEPASIVFTPDGRKAYVTVSQENAVAVLDGDSKQLLRKISLETPPSFNTQDPRAMAIDATGEFLYVVPFESGNRTRGDHHQGIVHDPGLSDVDLFVIRVSDDAIVSRVENLGTILTNIRVGPDNSRLYITGRDARNLVRTVHDLDGHPTINRLVILDRATLGVIRRVDLDGAPPYEPSRAVAQPSDLVFDDRGRLWVAAQGNDDLAILDRDGNFLRRVPAGAAPRGLAFDPREEAIYVFNRVSHDITAIETRRFRHRVTVDVGYDPLPERLREGRALLYSARQSADRSQACVACHADGHSDNLVWDLGETSDPKGPMFTMSLRGLADNAPYHWRGERESLLDFNRAFEDLFLGERLTDEENEKLAEFMGSIDYPPNPLRNRDGSLRGLALCGEQLFRASAPRDCPPPGPSEHRQSFPCVDCHALPHGSNHEIIDGRMLGTEEDLEVPQQRGVHEKVAVGHDGRHPTVIDLLSQRPPFPAFPEVDKRAMQEFVLQFPTSEHHAAVGTARTITRDQCPGGNPDVEIEETVEFLEQQSVLGNVDLTVAGSLEPLGKVHLLFDPSAGDYRIDREGASRRTAAALLRSACDGTASLSFTAWPAGTGMRSLDRDEDGLFNGDEPRFGTVPSDPDGDDDGLADGEELAAGTDPLSPDSDGDGVLDGPEIFDGTDPLNPDSVLRFVSVTASGDATVELVWTTVPGRRYEVERLDADRSIRPEDEFVHLFTTPTPEDESPEGTERFVDESSPGAPGWLRFYRVRALPRGS